jgi:hypothetical protein
MVSVGRRLIRGYRCGTSEQQRSRYCPEYAKNSRISKDRYLTFTTPGS